MAARKPPEQGKTRTPEHITADLAVNHVQRQVLLAGFTMEQIVHDYGYDAMIFVYNRKGEREPGVVFVQVKSAARLERLQGGEVISFRLERADLRHWLIEAMPVVLCLYERESDQTYWLHIQRYFESMPDFNLFLLGATTTVHIPITQTWTPAALGIVADELRAVTQQSRRRE
jgi:hypothetical protein